MIAGGGPGRGQAGPNYSCCADAPLVRPMTRQVEGSEGVAARLRPRGHPLHFGEGVKVRLQAADPRSIT